MTTKQVLVIALIDLTIGALKALTGMALAMAIYCLLFK